MRPTFLMILALVVVPSIFMIASCSGRSAGGLHYPEARRSDQVDVLHGVEVADPYRWLEDPDSEETRAWVEAENKLTFSYLDSIPQREAIRERLTTLWDFERFTVPIERGGLYFYRRNDGLQPQSVLMVCTSLEGEARVLLDPNTLSEDGTVALSSAAPSPDGQWLAYSTSSGGSDWREFRIRNVATGEDLDDLVQWSKFSPAVWARDSSGFYYNRFDEPTEGDELEQANFFQKIYFHKAGTSQDADALIFERPQEKEWTFETTTSDDGRYLVILMNRGTDSRGLVQYRDLTAGGPFHELIGKIEAEYTFVGNDGPVMYFLTTKDAPSGRLVAIDTRKPEPESWKELIPETGHLLAGVTLVGDVLIARYLEDARSRIRLFALNGSVLGEVELPGIGQATGFRGDREATETFYSFQSFTQPGTILHLDLETRASTVFRAPKVGFDPEQYVTEQVFFSSKDGTRVPMFISYRKGREPGSPMPTILTGYGGFNINRSPRFAVSSLVWMEIGGVLASANLRGGGEYGEEWHRQGSLDEKQNTFDDFIAAAEWLIANGYTSTEKLSIAGGSNGGLLVGAVLNQRPDLFAAAVPAVGVMDMLRFHKFTIGWAWVSDYGSPDDPEMFPVLYRYSPLHNIQPGTAYPATLIMTADHDDRVVPAHSFKYAATLQAAQGGPRPILIRIETRAGHGSGMPTGKQIAEAADRLAFLVRELGMSPEL